MILFFGNKLHSDVDWPNDHPRTSKNTHPAPSLTANLYPLLATRNHPGIAAAKPLLENSPRPALCVSSFLCVLLAHASDRWPIIHTARLKPLKKPTEFISPPQLLICQTRTSNFLTFYCSQGFPHTRCDGGFLSNITRK